MKIYTHVRIDMVTGREVFAKGYDYEGPFAFAAGNTVPIHGKVTRIAYGTAPATVMDFTDGWSIDVTLDVADASRLGQNWKEILPGQASANGAANGYLVLVDSFWKAIEDNIDTTQDYFLLQLFSWDPDKDQSGDHFSAWVTFTSFGTGGNINEVVKEAVAFQVYGIPSFTANA